jgi:hypothetical protein
MSIRQYARTMKKSCKAAINSAAPMQMNIKGDPAKETLPVRTS